MTYHQLDQIADICDPLLIVGLIVAAFSQLKRAAWPFALRSALAVILAQQISKFSQKHHFLGAHFPSTHFAVALALLTCFVVLKPKWWPYALGFATIYAVLMLWQNYHTPLEMAGALFAVPFTLLFHAPRRKTAITT